ncbi:MAG: hypothetical protein IJ816_02495 [Alloprevotella sp.]|nr:hypothetical protein [Alloprevotella sp.]
MKAKKLYLSTHRLAGRKYHDVDEVWEELKVGTPLRLVLDRDNRFDPQAVAVIYTRPEDEEEFLLGYVPRTENTLLYNFLVQGWDNIFSARITKKDAEAHPENQIEYVVRINPCEA